MWLSHCFVYTSLEYWHLERFVKNRGLFWNNKTLCFQDQIHMIVQFQLLYQDKIKIWYDQHSTISYTRLTTRNSRVHNVVDSETNFTPYRTIKGSFWKLFLGMTVAQTLQELRSFFKKLLSTSPKDIPLPIMRNKNNNRTQSRHRSFN